MIDNTPILVEVRKSKGNQFNPEYLNGVLHRYDLSSVNGKRIINLQIHTNENWTIVDQKDFGKIILQENKTKEIADNFIRLIEI